MIYLAVGILVFVGLVLLLAAASIGADIDRAIEDASDRATPWR